MRKRWVIYLGSGNAGGSHGRRPAGPAPVGAVAREIVELQTERQPADSGPADHADAITQNEAVRENPDRAVRSIPSTNSAAPWATCRRTCKTCRRLRARAWIPCPRRFKASPTISRRLLARMGKLNQQLTDAQNAIQGIDAKLASARASRSRRRAGGHRILRRDDAGGASLRSGRCAAIAPAAPSSVPASASVPAAAAPSADLLYSNGLRDLNGRKYDLANQEFQDYLKYYSALPIWPRTRSSIWARSPSPKKQYDQAVDAYSKVIDKYPEELQTRAGAPEERAGACGHWERRPWECANCAWSSSIIQAPTRNAARAPN